MYITRVCINLKFRWNFEEKKWLKVPCLVECTLHQIWCLHHSDWFPPLVIVKYAVWIFPIFLHVSLMILCVCELNTKLLPPSSFVYDFVRHVSHSLDLALSHFSESLPKNDFEAPIYICHHILCPLCRWLSVPIAWLVFFRWPLICICCVVCLHAHTCGMQNNPLLVCTFFVGVKIEL